MLYMRTKKHYLAQKRKFSYRLQAGMNLEGIILSEIRQSQKDKCCMIPPIYEVLRAVNKFIEMESGMKVAKEVGRGI